MASNSLPDESEILTKMAEGDQYAFTTLYNSYSKQLFAKINHMVNDEETAKELLQDAFFKIWIQRKNVDVKKPFRSFLFTIAVNLVYDHFRKLAKDRKYAQTVLQNAVDYYTHAEEAIHSKESMKLIQQAIDLLPPQRKQIFMLCKLEGKSYDQVASLLSISTSTVKDHIVKGNKVVRDYLLKNPDLVVLSFITATLLK